MPDNDLGNSQSAEAIVRNVVEYHFPNGDPLFYEITAEEMAMYNRKNKDYAGGAEGEVTDPNGNFHRCAQFWSMYPGISLGDPRVVALSHMMKQMDQICWSLSRGYEGEVEGLDPRFMDVHIYAKIARVIHQNMTAKPAPEKTDRGFPGYDEAEEWQANRTNAANATNSVRGQEGHRVMVSGGADVDPNSGYTKPDAYLEEARPCCEAGMCTCK